MEGFKNNESYYPKVIEETRPGGFIVLNDDDDNNNGTPDKDEGGVVAGEDDLVKITLMKVVPTDIQGVVTLNALAGGSKIKVWESATKGTLVTLPKIYATPTELPKELWVEGVETSSTARDITLALQCGGFDDRIKATVVKVNLTSTDLYGTVPEPNEETPGAFIHFNLDNDDSSDNSVEGPKRPGADYANDTTTVTGEDDLKSLTMTMIPSLSEGIVVLTNTSSGEIWKSSTKGTGNRLLAYGSLSWDLSDPNKKSEFLSLCASPLYMEGAAGTGGEIALRYYSPGGSMVHLDKIKYTFIAADCGDQPRTDNGQRNRFQKPEGPFPLTGCEWSITHNILTQQYNCIAYSAGGITDRWFNPIIKIESPPGSGNFIYYKELYIDMGSYIQHLVSIDGYYGNDNHEFEMTDLDAFYLAEAGYTPTASGPDDAKAMYYSGYHAALKRSCSCGTGKWIMYESKCGGMERIEHVHDQLNGSSYGSPTRFYK